LGVGEIMATSAPPAVDKQPNREPINAENQGFLGGVVLVLHAVDGVISAIFGALLLPSRIGSVPFPVS
jgi:hypothetical protein